MLPNHPIKLPAKLDISIFAKEMAEAAMQLGRLDGMQKELPDPTLILTPLTAKEAETSSKIEGTVSTVPEVMSYEAGEHTENKDTPIVASYRRAMTMAIPELRRRELNQSFIRDLHSILLENSRGHEARGKYRSNQVFLGKVNSKIEEATYIPPEPILIQEYMDNWEEYLLKVDDIILIKAGLLHYQFEAIHPFGDGNGRIGRLFIPLYFYNKHLLMQPVLYISGYFERNRDEYINALHQVDVSHKYEYWLKFFFKAVAEQSIETQKLIEDIKNLRRDVEKRAETMKSPYSSKVIEFMFMKPVFTNTMLGEHISNRITASRITKRLVALGILKTIKTNKRFYLFMDLLKIV
jgi:Fic family protein